MGVSLRKKLYAMENKKAPTIKAEPEVLSFNCHKIKKTYTPSISLPNKIPSSFLSFLSKNEKTAIDLEKILFIDTETTGLSRGVGTVAFLVGIGYIKNSEFIVEQFLMEDYLQEKDMLQQLLTSFSAFDAYATFNGKTYDIPLLQSRFIMNKLPYQIFSLPHSDVLHSARRTWKLRLKQCSLCHLEERILDIYRKDDLPGHLIPQRYFDFIKTKNFFLLEDIVSHNQQDILSLFLLFQALFQVYTAPEQQSFPEDLFSTAKQFEKQGELDKAYRCYRLSATGRLRAPAYLLLGKSYQREKNNEKALALYQQMIGEKQGGLRPYIQLAKIYEHQLKDIPSALNCVEKGLAYGGDLLFFAGEAVQDDKNDLQYRYMRLLKKNAKLAK